MQKVYGFLFAVLSSCSVCAVVSDGLVPYVGMNAQLRKVDFKHNYGDNTFAKKMPQGEVYAGFKLNPYLGCELAYLRSVESNKSSANKASVNFGIALPAGFFEEAKNSSRIDGGSLSVLGFLPITQDFQLLGSFGLARLRAKLQYVPSGDDTGSYTSTQIAEFTRNYVAWRYLPQLKAGMQYMLTEAVGLKALVGWDGTGRFNLLNNKEATLARVSLKDSYNVGLGLTYYFN